MVPGRRLDGAPQGARELVGVMARDHVIVAAAGYYTFVERFSALVGQKTSRPPASSRK
jgi:hypothetical protein